MDKVSALELQFLREMENKYVILDSYKCAEIKTTCSDQRHVCGWQEVQVQQGGKVC